MVYQELVWVVNVKIFLKQKNTLPVHFYCFFHRPVNGAYK
jgi:hypothetical protein